MMSEKKKNMSPNDIAYHRRYGVLANLKYVLVNMINYDRKLIIILLLGIICEPLTRYFWMFFPKIILDYITDGGNQTQLIYFVIIGFLFQLVFTVVNSYYNSEIWWRYFAARFFLIGKMNRKVMSMNYQHLEDSDVMDCYQRAKNACGSNVGGVEGMMRATVTFLISLATATLGITILGMMNIWIVVLMIILAFLCFLVVNQGNKISKEEVWNPLASWWRKRDYMQHITTTFSAAKDIRIFGLQKWLSEKYRILNKERYNAQKINAKIWTKTTGITNILKFISQIPLYVWVVYAVINEQISIGSFFLYLSAADTIFENVSLVLNGASNIMARSLEVDDFRTFLDFEDESQQNKGIILEKQDEYRFEFQNVSFKYPKAEKYSLKNLNLSIADGEHLSVVGINGAGKSTMIKLLLRLYEPTEGRILLNNIDIREYERQSYYDVFAPVFQKTELFAFPLDENVSMKAPQKTDSIKAENCLVMAGLSNKIKSLSKGVKTEVLKVIYDDGVDLSGGEKQKLALARALYKDASVIVLDEPTAAFDALAEATLYEEFDKLIQGKTAVFVSHRLGSTRFCDKVAMFENGEMIEYGTYSDLLERGGAFANLYRIQSQYYVDSVENSGGDTS